MRPPNAAEDGESGESLLKLVRLTLVRLQAFRMYLIMPVPVLYDCYVKNGYFIQMNYHHIYEPLLFSDTKCKSHNGRRYVKCPSGGGCFPEETFNEEKDCKGGKPSECRTIDKGVEGWRCNDGLCIDIEKVCNNQFDCKDRSDESDGCDIYPETNCKSWFGLEHVKCVVKGRM